MRPIDLIDQRHRLIENVRNRPAGIDPSDRPAGGSSDVEFSCGLLEMIFGRSKDACSLIRLAVSPRPGDLVRSCDPVGTAFTTGALDRRFRWRLQLQQKNATAGRARDGAYGARIEQVSQFSQPSSGIPSLPSPWAR